MLAVLGSMFVWAAGEGTVAEGHNPARGIEKYPEEARANNLTLSNWRGWEPQSGTPKPWVFLGRSTRTA